MSFPTDKETYRFSSYTDPSGLRWIYNAIKQRWARFTPRVLVPSGVPASATAPGVAGTVLYDASYIYVCVETNKWTRISRAW